MILGGIHDGDLLGFIGSELYARRSNKVVNLNFPVIFAVSLLDRSAKNDLKVRRPFTLKP
jgi:hypothetical protein